MKLKNLAIVAHVDHGKTTLVDEVLKQSSTFDPRAQYVERVMDSGELEKERGITITAKNCSFSWKDTKINLLDTPGHADFGGEVERSLIMVDGILLLVDAAEGPLPQTRFVLQKAIERGLKIACMINKVDRQDARVEEVRAEVEDLFLEMAHIVEKEFDLDIPFFYGSGKLGYATREFGKTSDNLTELLDFMISDFYPAPNVSEEGGLQLLVSNLSYSPYLGPLVVGRIERGRVKKHQEIMLAGENSNKAFRVTNIQVFSGLDKKDVDQAVAGEIAIIAGITDAKIGDTVCVKDAIEPLTRLTVEPPTVSVQVSVNTSPLSGKEGEYLTSRRLEEFLIEACMLNVALKYEPTDDPKVFTLKGRGELQFAIVFEELRRKGFEFMVARPQVLTQKGPNGEELEPFEQLVLDVPNENTGAMTQQLAERKGVMEKLLPLGEGRSRMEFVIPSRGIIGFRSMFLTTTKGTGLMSSLFLGYRPSVGKMLSRTNGAIISDRAGKTTPYALFNLLSSGKQFIVPGDLVYEGMVIGESTRSNDINVNAVREKHLSSVRTAGKDENIILPPVPKMSLEKAMDWIDDDELIEVTPLNVRIRKREMAQGKRSVIR